MATSPTPNPSKPHPSNLFTSLFPLLDTVRSHLNQNDLRSAIISAFHLSPADSYVYHATASVTLSQVQHAINAGHANGLCDWYLDNSGKPIGHPPVVDISAYISFFDPSKSPANLLKGFLANAKKESLRRSVAEHLTSTRYIHPSVPTISKLKAKCHANLYIDFWSWCCQSLSYCGPNKHTLLVKTSHHVLPVFKHHFGCACPSYEALALISSLSRGRTIIDLGSGNGYWTYILRAEHGCEVIAVDSGQSQWRTMWVNDTVATDGIRFLKDRPSTLQDVLLMVYPVVSTDFTPAAIRAFQGSTICIAATQNGSGYSGFKDEKVDVWFKREMKGKWERIVQVPLPSFPGKDDALFVFRKREI